MPIFFTEVQFQVDANLYRRLFAEIFHYLHKNLDAKDWQAVVIYPRRNLEPEQQEPYRALLNSPQVQRIYLDEWARTESIPIELGIVQLIVESRRTAPDWPNKCSVG